MSINLKLSDQDRLNQTVQLSNGRILGYAEYGHPDGFPVFYFHGGNSSRLEGQWLEKAALAQNIRLIAPDRPGFGLSDHQPKRTFLSWADDVSQLANTLNIGRFAVMGLSGGGPFAAAVGYKLPERVSGVTIVSGVAPPEMPNQLKGVFLPLRFNFWAARRSPRLSRTFLKLMGNSYADPEKFRQMVLKGMPAPDKALAQQHPEAIFQFSASAVEGHRNGIEGDLAEWQLYVYDWGFPLNNISAPVSLWYGAVDNFAPHWMGRYLAAQIPGSVFHLVEDGGHFSTINNHAEAILAELQGTSLS